jgi:hypothetical protein
MRGYFSVPGLFSFIMVSIIMIALLPVIIGIVNSVLGQVDSNTQIALLLLCPIVLIALLIGYYNSVVSRERSYVG